MDRARFLRRRAYGVLGVLGVLSLGAYLDSRFWLSSLMSHFRLQYALAALILIGLFLVLRRPRWALAAGIVFALNLIPLVPYLGPSEAVEASSDGLVVAQINSHRGQAIDAAGRRRLAELGADVLVVHEVDQRAATELVALASYPYRRIQARDDPYGVAILSRFPLTVESIGGRAPGGLGGSIETPMGRIGLVALHPPPPMTPGMRSARNRQLQLAARRVTEVSGPVLVVGDLNVSVFAGDFKRFLGAAGVTDPRRDHGLLPTWPVQPWWSQPLAIPIDHILPASGLTVVELDRFVLAGTDHRGLRARIVRASRGPGEDSPGSTNE